MQSCILSAAAIPCSRLERVTMSLHYPRNSIQNSLCLTLALLFACSFNAYHPTDTGTPSGLDAQGYTREGERYLRRGNYEKADEMFAKAIELDGYRGYARLGAAKAAFDKWGFSQRKLQELFLKDTAAADTLPFQTIVRLFNEWTYDDLDSLYAPAHVAVDADEGVLNAMFDEAGFEASDDFDPVWIAADFSLLLAFHAFVGLLDFNDDGHITEEDNPFAGLSIEITEDTVIIQGLQAILDDQALRAQWIANANESMMEADEAARVFVETFGDSTTSYDAIDTLLVDLEQTLTGTTH